MSGSGGRGSAWAELLRLPALLTVPGDALAGAAARGSRPGRGTFLAVGASVSLYAAGMALNDWADRDEDARDRPHRPLPSGRIRPAHALVAAAALTASGLALASRANRTTGAVATALAATVWAYDLHLKGTRAGPAAMGAARGLDLLMGATASPPRGADVGVPSRVGVPCGAARADASSSAVRAGLVRAVARVGLAPAADRGGVSSAVARGGASSSAVRAGLVRAVARVGLTPAAVRAGLPSAAVCAGLVRASARVSPPPTDTRTGLTPALTAAVALATHTAAVTTVSRNEAQGGASGAPLLAMATTAAIAGALLATRGRAPVAALPVTAYASTALRPLLHAALNPSPPLTQRAVGSGIRALVPLQSALAARSGAPVTALATLALVPLARRFAKRVSIT